MEIKPAHRVQSARPPATPDLAARAIELARSGRDIIDFSGTGSDLSPPPEILAAARAALDAAPDTSGGGAGAAALQTAIVAKFERDNDLRFGPEQVVVTHGARHALYILMQTLLNEDDEVVVPAPYWPGYPELARLAGADPVIVRTRARHRFRMTPEELRGALGRRTRLVILNNPCNPSGVVYGRGELEALARVLVEFPEVVVVCDEVYEYQCRSREPFATLLNVAPRLHERTVIVNGLTKTWGMDDWRVGYAAGPARLIGAMQRVQALSTAAPGAVVQAAAVAALAAPRELLAERNAALERRHAHLHAALSAIDGIDVQAGEGGHHLLPHVGRVIDRLAEVDDDFDLAARLLEQAGVLTLPGSACGMPGYLRLGYALDDARLVEGTRRLASVLGGPSS
ncbi:MAG: aminotransferase class I/II-fold pyridoxal phosphate-dependent enzyme [Gammaproteobacteria bacterium]|nr:aminotransferase class I/II-fold pyridoxal phosphate-dependent enzyme [Gammaproteobacteria bacterium]